MKITPLLPPAIRATSVAPVSRLWRRVAFVAPRRVCSAGLLTGCRAGVHARTTPTSTPLRRCATNKVRKL